MSFSKKHTLPFTVTAYCALLLWGTGQQLLAERPHKHYLWKATRNNVTFYLSGTLHVFKREYYPLDDVFYNAYQNADTLILEADISEAKTPETQSLISSSGFYADSTSLDSHLSALEFQDVADRWKKLGMDVAPLKRMKPWLAALLMATATIKQMGYNSEDGIDRHFSSLAAIDGKPVSFFETMEYQLDIFSGMIPATQTQLLMQTVREYDEFQPILEKMITAWRTGDDHVMDSVKMQSFDGFPDLKEIINDGRNNNWLATIEKKRKCHATYMVLVGSLHLCGSDGLVTLLRNKGYTIVQK